MSWCLAAWPTLDQPFWPLAGNLHGLDVGTSASHSHSSPHQGETLAQTIGCSTDRELEHFDQDDDFSR